MTSAIAYIAVYTLYKGQWQAWGRLEKAEKRAERKKRLRIAQHRLFIGRNKK